MKPSLLHDRPQHGPQAVDKCADLHRLRLQVHLLALEQLDIQHLIDDPLRPLAGCRD